MLIPLREYANKDSLGLVWSAITVSGAGSNNVIQTPDGVLYFICIATGNDPFWFKSTDRGRTWSSSGSLHGVTATQISVWYDRWTDPTGALGDNIHFIYAESGTDDVFYYCLDTTTDTLSSRSTPFAGSSTLAGCAMSITRAKSGNLIIAGSIDAGTENFAYKSATIGNSVSWSAISNPFEATTDQLMLAPDFATDTSDIICVYYDVSATELSLKRYDDSANSWSESSISTGITLPLASVSYPHFNICVDHTNSQTLVGVWTGIDTASASLKFYKITSSAITALTSVVSSSTDDQQSCVVCIDDNTNYWYVFYAGSTDGNETVNTNLKIHYKESTDGGSTWGDEQTVEGLRANLIGLMGTPHFKKVPCIVRLMNSTSSAQSNTIPSKFAAPNYNLGI